MLKNFSKVLLSLGCLGLWASLSWGHFLVLKPETDNVEAKDRPLRVEALFTHPMEGGPHMEFQIKESALLGEGERLALTWHRKLIPAGKNSSKKVSKYNTEIKLSRPRVYQLYIVPEPYFEPAEGKFIKQITKVIFSAFGKEEGWEVPVGLKVEIIPLVKPFSLWEGNLFKGRVLVDGKPAGSVDVEVEYLNLKGYKVPVESLTTQVVKTDEHGYFEYVLPWEGWWGFSAIVDGGKITTPEGKEYPLELDAVLWVKAYPKPKGGK